MTILSKGKINFFLDGNFYPLTKSLLIGVSRFHFCFADFDEQLILAPDADERGLSGIEDNNRAFLNSVMNVSEKFYTDLTDLLFIPDTDRVRSYMARI
jgi:hypothetical protein